MSKEKAQELINQLEIMLALAPEEDECSDAENEIFAEAANMKQALENNIDSLKSVLA